jgi:antitoxin (DNA-binding transcriptional repressor) of toxin-antitoxin stability system
MACMGFPATVPPPDDRHHEVSVREARMRLPHLVGLVRVGDQVTVLTDDAGRPAAALVPVEAARTVAQARAARTRAEASAAGWSRRLDAVRDQHQRRHEAEMRTITDALTQAWAELDARYPPGGDAALDRLRAAHQPWLPHPRPSS